MGRMRYTAATVGALLVTAAPAAALPADSILTNGSFEAPDIASGHFAIFASIPGWSHRIARAGVTSSGIEIQDHVAGAPEVGAGDQFVELDSDGPSTIFQDTATEPGLTYRFAFLWSTRPNTAAQQNHFTASAGPASAEIGPQAGSGQTNWQSHSDDFVATDASTTVRFTDLGPEESFGGLGAYLDEVSLVPVYDLCLLYDPSKAHKAGSTAPIKLQLCDTDGDNLSSPSLVLHATSLEKIDGSASSTVEDSGQANPDADFRYDADLAGYIFNLSTAGLTAGTWELSFTVNGGDITYTVRFDVR